MGNFEAILVLSSRFQGENFFPENNFFAENAKLIFCRNAQIRLLTAASQLYRFRPIDALRVRFRKARADHPDPDSQ